MKHAKTILSAITTAVAASLLLAGCSMLGSFGTSTGTVSLSLTDAPIVDAANIEGVYITIESIEYNVNETWVTADTFEGPMVFNLLDLTGGEVAPLADTVLPAGEISQIRFMLAATEEGTQSSGNPGCYIKFTDDTTETLFVPSGGQSGYKATGSFTIPANGTVTIAADFDVRKSVTYAGNLVTENGFYLLRPTIKLVVTDQAGTLSGSFIPDQNAYESYVVFAYENDTYTSTEATPVDDDTAPFQHAAGSAVAMDSDSDDDTEPDSYLIAFLAPGTYDLVVAGVDADGVYTVLNETDYIDVTVESELTTTENIDLTPTP